MILSASTSPHSLPDISGYAIVEQLYLGSRTAVYRAVEKAQQRSVVIKLLRREYPRFGELVQFRNQYTIAQNLPIPGIVRPLRLEPWGSGYALVMEDCGGIALGRYIQQQSLDLADVLAIALQVADILHNLCQHRVVHKDIKPANILIHPESKQIKLIDFSIASLLPKETQESQSPNILEGTLAYLAPEQTGRMNRGIDYRADFYALGVTLYQLLTGTLPFVSDDPLELMHCHIAKVPVPVDQVNPDVPATVAAIVTKLMAKNAEDRYQSAMGLKYDLEQCLSQWKATGAITTFALGQRDVSDRFLIPEKLYGREAEVQALLEAFDRVANGSSELMLVAGFSGIGKTAVINEVHKPIVRQRGYFIKGKFDQFNRNIPLSAFVQALRDLMGQLLSESDTQLAQWQAKILAAVGENGQVLIEVIPELEQIIGKQPIALDLAGVAAQNRFNLLFQNFIEVFTTAEHPLVLFLDDLQWADSASLQLVKLLMNDSGHLLVLGAYRDNEVSSVHPFVLTVEDLKNAQVIVHTMTLAPLTFDDTNHLVADTLKCSRELAQPPTELIDRKTQGNPFFTTQFLKALHEDGQIRFDHDRCYWECDIAQVKSLSITDDVVEFMALQLQKLPAASQQVLKLAACIGNQFDLATLAIVSGQSLTETASSLWKALQEGLILPITETYKFFQSADAEIDGDRVAVSYKFLHDRVQQSAYSLIDQAQKQATHLHIGTLLLENLTASQREERLFEIVNHFNVGKTAIVQPAKREELAQLNFLAGCKAKASTAYAAALDYIQAAIDLLPDNCFESHYQLSFELYKARAEVEYLNGNFKTAEIWIEQALANAKTPLEKADIYSLAIVQCTLQAQYPEAIQAGRQALALIGINLPTENLETALASELAISTKTFKNSSFAMLSQLPTMVQPEQKMAIKLLISMGPPTYRSHQRLWSVICAKAVNLCLQYGNTPEIGYIYPAFGGLRGYALNNYQETDQLLDITLQLIQAFDNKSAESVAYLMIGSSLRHWSHPLKAATEDYLASYRVGLESSNLQYAAYAFGHNMYCRFYQSVPLDRLLEEVTESLNFSQKHKNQWAIDLLLGGHAIMAELMGTQEKERYRSLCESETEYLEQCKAHKNWQVICIFNILKTQVLFFCDRLDEALEYGQQADAEIINVAPQGLLPYAHHLFIYALLLASLYPNATEAQKLDYWEKIETYQNQLEVWAQSCPYNFSHLYCLVKAEVARLSQNYLEAIDLYDRAIAEANANGYLQEEAIAHELAAKFYLHWGKEKFAASYLQDAYYSYARWGAKAKVQDLERRYPKLLAPILQPQQLALSATETMFAPGSLTATQSSISSSSSISATLDLATVLKASQTLSSEIQLDKLLATLLHTVLENAGADKGALLMPHEHQWFVEALAVVDQPVQVQAIAFGDSLELPHGLINSVKRSLQPIVIVDAAVHPALAMDAYIVQQQPKSILCTPILQQGKLVAILYLENHVTVGAFTRDRVELLNVLCAQAAISLENAHLYQQAQTYAQQIEQSQLQVIQNEKMAALGNLVAGVAHEINNPIGFLNGSINNAKDYVQDLLRHLALYQQHYPNAPAPVQAHAADVDLEYLSADLPKLLNSMQGATDRIKSISTSLRTFSRADAEQKVRANLHAGIDSTLLILKYRLKADEYRPAIEIIQDYGDLPEIECFPGQLNQVFMNILANAIDVFDEVAQQTSLAERQTKPQTIAIQTTVMQQPAIEIRISDNGKGMAEAVKAKVFDHLFTTKGVGKGTGMGLAIARQIVVEKHSGSLDVQSELGQGSEFLIRLPIQS
ncbi:AAA family ATPase [Oculatella sp. LEGE 06141]|uniref:trifunctional serine/threonine-protein kinase/ATP-binding protein/sensor histidine kinase n=1 Tax=Oculatella sp. LEGE 06141 TaxID=1828648 RepID=UPI00188072BD|nr:ATP-binding sensor histidine kinase [Oculatella sp. LEGE 06141]MBE9182580.1 AAA family ATPase [Oculatella sp. LEGE 06141]